MPSIFALPIQGQSYGHLNYVADFDLDHPELYKRPVKNIHLMIEDPVS